MKTPEQDLFDRLQGAAAVKPTAPFEGGVVEKLIEKDNPDVGKPVTLRNLFTHQDSHPVVIDFSLLKAFGTQWMGWEPETIWTEIHRAFEMKVSEVARAKIQTIKTLHVSNTAWDHWQVFEKIIQGLNGIVPRWGLMQPPVLEQLYVGIDMLEHIRVVEFSSEVKLYMASAVHHEEVTFVPPPLDFIRVEVSQPYYHCLDCGSEDSALFHDGFCDTCTKKFDSEQGLSMKPNQELLNQGRGRNVVLHLRHDPTLVQKRWEEVKDQPLSKVDLKEDEVDVQVAKLLAARDYMNIKRRHLAEQLVSLKSWLGTS